jgi:hypothetical protein
VSDEARARTLQKASGPRARRASPRPPPPYDAILLWTVPLALTRLSECGLSSQAAGGCISAVRAGETRRSQRTAATPHQQRRSTAPDALDVWTTAVAAAVTSHPSQWHPLPGCCTLASLPPPRPSLPTTFLARSSRSPARGQLERACGIVDQCSGHTGESICSQTDGHTDLRCRCACLASIHQSQCVSRTALPPAVARPRAHVRGGPRAAACPAGSDTRRGSAIEIHSAHRRCSPLSRCDSIRSLHRERSEARRARGVHQANGHARRKGGRDTGEQLWYGIR